MQQHVQAVASRSPMSAPEARGKLLVARQSRDRVAALVAQRALFLARPERPAACGPDPLEREADAVARKVATSLHSRRDGARPAVDRRASGTMQTGTDQVQRHLGHVRIHVGANVDRAADALSARAFTVGDDVYMRRAEYWPGTRRGDELLAHELTHTFQQRDGRVGRGEVVQRKLLDDEQAWMRATTVSKLGRATSRGKLGVVDQLLADYRAGATDEDNRAEMLSSLRTALVGVKYADVGTKKTKVFRTRAIAVYRLDAEIRHELALIDAAEQAAAAAAAAALAPIAGAAPAPPAAVTAE